MVKQGLNHKLMSLSNPKLSFCSLLTKDFVKRASERKRGASRSLSIYIFLTENKKIVTLFFFCFAILMATLLLDRLQNYMCFKKVSFA